MVHRALQLLGVGLALGQAVTAAGQGGLVATGSMHAYVSLHTEWSVEIDANGYVQHASNGGRCQLTDEEQAELRRTLSVLPSGTRKYVFGGPVPTDAYPLFKLTIRQSGKVREYSAWKLDHPHPDDKQIARVHNAWIFLAGLCRRKEGEEASIGRAP